MIRAVVVDIEGTTSATRFVTSTLFPYARERYANYLAEHQSEPDLMSILVAVRDESGEPETDEARIVAILESWTDADAKITPLKTIQGHIWQEGFARGDLIADFFPDVIPALRRWHDQGMRLAVFSSGSVDAQQAWFAHTPEGDLRDLVSGYFDTANAGPKREADSYRTIATRLAVPADAIVFLSDVRAELDAARAAGWATVGVLRDGEPFFAAGAGDHATIDSFDELEVVSRRGG